MTRSRKKTPCGHYVKKDGWWKGCYNRSERPCSRLSEGKLTCRRCYERFFICK